MSTPRTLIGIPDKNIPAESYDWLNDDVAQKLRAIPAPHQGKKRISVIKLAFARANETPWRTIFEQADTCSEVIWYTKWQYDPDIAAAYQACFRRVLDWTDKETSRLQAYYTQQRRRSIAEWSAVAPGALAAVMTDGEQKGSDRISAANALITWADPEAAGKAAPPAPPAGADQTILNLGIVNQMKEDELDALLDNLEAAESGPAAGPPSPEPIEESAPDNA
jgi:hypothetical protein